MEEKVRHNSAYVFMFREVQCFAVLSRHAYVKIVFTSFKRIKNFNFKSNAIKDSARFMAPLSKATLAGYSSFQCHKPALLEASIKETFIWCYC